MKDVTYTTDGFRYLAMIENTPVSLCVKKDFPAKTCWEFIAYAKANPGKVTVSGVGKNSGPHLAVLPFQKLAGVKFTYVPYKGPAAETGHHGWARGRGLHELPGRGGDAAPRDPVSCRGHREKRMKLPDAPTFKEAGVRTTRASTGDFRAQGSA